MTEVYFLHSPTVTQTTGSMLMPARCRASMTVMQTWVTMWSPSPATVPSVPVQPYLIILSSQTAEILPTPTSSAAKINSYFTKQYFCYEAIIPGSLHFFPLPLGFSLHLCLCFIFHIEADQTLGPASGHEAAGRGPDVRHLVSSSASSSSCSESVLLAVSQSPSVTLSD